MKVIRYRIKDSSKLNQLSRLSSQVNFVWNTCNDLIRKNWKESRKYTQKSDINRLVKGASRELDLNQQTVQAIGYELLLRIRKIRKQVRFRSRKKSLPWIPFNGQTIKLVGDIALYNKMDFKVFKSRELCGKIKTGSFVCDSRGRWYVNFCCEDNTEAYCGLGEVGIDLGLITTATTSQGEKLKASRYRRWEKKLANAQRANKQKLAKKIHAKIKNTRKDAIEKFTTKIAQENSLVVIGKIESNKIIKTPFAKSTYDNGWFLLKSRLSHKVVKHGGKYLEVPENFTSRTCSHCNLGWILPKGLKSLAIREYQCPGCGFLQDRDVNAARNILRIGHDSLLTNGAGIPHYNCEAI
jgi:putative transposase